MTRAFASAITARSGSVVAHTEFVPVPPIGAPGDDGLTAQPPAVVIGVIVAAVIAGPPIPHPYAIDEVAVSSVMKVVMAMVVMVIEGVAPIAVNVTVVPQGIVATRHITTVHMAHPARPAAQRQSAAAVE